MRIGSEPIHFQWSNGKEDICDISALVLARRGAKFQRLQVNEGGLLIYCYERMILWVGAICRTDIGRPIIFVFEGD
jgi:hypothetical protein